jgi:hypothetical protein
MVLVFVSVCILYSFLRIQLAVPEERLGVYHVKINEDGSKKCADPISAGGFLISVAFWRISARFRSCFSLTEITFFQTRETFQTNIEDDQE